MPRLPLVAVPVKGKTIRLAVKDAELLIDDLRSGIRKSRLQARLTPVASEKDFVSFLQVRKFFIELYEDESRGASRARKLFDKLMFEAYFNRMEIEVYCTLCNQRLTADKCPRGIQHGYFQERLYRKIRVSTLLTSADDFTLRYGEGETMQDNFDQLLAHLPQPKTKE